MLQYKRPELTIKNEFVLAHSTQAFLLLMMMNENEVYRLILLTMESKYL